VAENTLVECQESLDLLEGRLAIVLNQRTSQSVVSMKSTQPVACQRSLQRCYSALFSLLQSHPSVAASHDILSCSAGYQKHTHDFRRATHSFTTSPASCLQPPNSPCAPVRSLHCSLLRRRNHWFHFFPSARREKKIRFQNSLHCTCANQGSSWTCILWRV
jgi:hypothetical protein